MQHPNGINHLAISTSDMRETLLYFNNALGFPLQALYWMHGVKDTVHGFLKVNDTSLLAFVYNPQVSPTIEVGKTHPGSIKGVSTKGTMHHLSFNVDSINDLEILQKSIRAKGIQCSELETDGLLTSIELPGPDGILLQVTCQESYPEEELFDLEAAQAVGINSEELNRMKSPAAYTSPASPVPNMPYGKDAGYRMNYPPATYKTMVAASDKVLFAATQDHIPPTKKQPRFRLGTFIAKMRLASLMVAHSITSLWRKS
ncbi:hypothetical protein R50073_13410 [Maricurvus nonylphenolicus]|uniref:VOC family protein n=1 Tax=Maricurvus nonylphenolicus TaxID=1008307 RepID=UPI0036F1B99E